MVALFDHEEVGSDSAQGAGSPAMLNALSRITNSFSSDSSVLASPFIFPGSLFEGGCSNNEYCTLELISMCVNIFSPLYASNLNSQLIDS